MLVSERGATLEYEEGLSGTGTKQQRKRLNKKRSKIINIESCPSDTVNIINSCMIKCFFLVVLKVKCLVSLKIVSHYAFAVAKGRLKVTKQMTIMVIIDDILLVTKYLTCFFKS